jgi:nitrile hydratase subunit alpha
MSAIPRQSYAGLRMKAIESLLIEKGYLTEEMVDSVAAAYEHDIGPLRGARVVARAWTDEDFKRRLLGNATKTIPEALSGDSVADQIVVVENTEREHNVVVCTLCSCYPWSVLGLPPRWYKTPEYRARMVREPRTVLSEFGLELGDEVEIRVWDSSASVRYMVLPQRPNGTEGLTREELTELVTRDSMIGTGLPKSP